MNQAKVKTILLTLFYTFLTLFCYSQKKTNSLVGTYIVFEEAQYDEIPISFSKHYEFIGKITKTNIRNLISFDQSSRIPLPIWVGADTKIIKYKFNPKTDSIICITGCTASGKIYNQNTIRIVYKYVPPTDGSHVYYIQQVWTKIK